jgi:tetratricopeptide (TPR) repeat protein
VRFKTTIAVLAAAVFLSMSMGCQSLHPFAQKTRSSLASARNWASGGLDAFHNGKLDQAKGLLSQATQQNPRDAAVRANFARTLQKSGDAQEALMQMQTAVELSHGDPRLRVELGEMHLQTNHPLLAARQADLALENNQRFAPAWVLRGKTEKSLGKTEKSLGKTENSNRNFEQALASFQRAMSYSNNLPDVEMEIVETYQLMQQPMKALAAVEQLLINYPSHDLPETAVIAKGVALINLKQYPPAIDLLQAASEKQNPSSDIFVRLSEAQLLAGRRSDAHSTLVRGKSVYPNLAVFTNALENLPSTEQRVATLIPPLTR